MSTAKSPCTGAPFYGRLGRRRTGWVKSNLSASNAKKANLSARKKEKIKIPSYGDAYHIREFFNHPSGIEAILNTRALQSHHSLDTNLYRCVLPQIQFLNFSVAPIVDLQITPTSEDCAVEMVSCKFEGSQVVERQNKNFSATMMNRIKWETIDSQQYLDIDVRLNLALEIYTQPFILMPVSAVEGPGNIMMQVLVDRLVPLLIQQLLQNYEEWINLQSRSLPSTK